MANLPSCYSDPLAAAMVRRTFSFGRSALLAAMRLLGIGAGDTVLLPGFICHEVLAPIAACGAKPAFYDVNLALEPAQSWTDWPAAKAVIAVNYFGFPQALDPFRAYCAHHGATLIEDNAHGWLGRDEDGAWLGLRGDLGIFSMRKSWRLPDGAALAIIRPDLAACAPLQLPSRDIVKPPSWWVERWLSRLPGTAPLVWSRRARRMWRSWRTGSALPSVDPEAETRMPTESAPHAGLQAALDGFDGALETERRRELYAWARSELAHVGVTGIWPTLPAGVVPYGYPFRADTLTDEGLRAAIGAMERKGLDVFVWPTLPAAIAARAPAHYQSTWLVNFL